MKITALYVQKNKDYVEGGTKPYLRVSGIGEDNKWVDVGALWKSKKGEGWSGQIKKGVLDFEPEVKEEVGTIQRNDNELEDVVGL